MKKSITCICTLALAIAMCISALSPTFAARQESFRVAIDLERNNWFGDFDFSGGYTVVQVGRGSGSRSAVIDRNGNEVQGVRFYSTHTFSEGLVPAFGRPEGGQIGFIDTSTNWAVPFVYDVVQPFSEGLAAVGMRGESRQVGAFSIATFNWGFVNRQGNLTIPHQFDEVSAFLGGRVAVARRDGVSGALRWGFIDTSGNITIPLIYENTTAPIVSDGLIAVSQNGRWGFIDEAGNTIIPFDFAEAKPFSMGLAAVRRGTRWGFIDRSGNEIIPFEHQYARSFSDGMAAVTLITTGVGRSYGFINTSGELVIPHLYVLVEDFSDGVASVALRDNSRGFAYGLIDTAGNIVVPIEFDHEILFSEGLAVVHRGEYFGYIDKTGREVIPIEIFGSGRNFVEGLASIWDFGGGGRMFIALTNSAPTQPVSQTNEQPSSWAVEQVNAAITAGLVPQNLQSNYTQATTRAEFAALAVSLYEYVTGRVITERMTFNDTNDVNVQKMGGLGVVAGVGNGNFNPDGTLTREQAAVMLVRLASAIGSPLAMATPTFADNGQISSWAVESVGQIQAAGIMGGVGNNQFAPQTAYTREQSIVTLLRLLR